MLARGLHNPSYQENPKQDNTLRLIPIPQGFHAVGMNP
jgi:hypothetical protein